MQFKVTINLPSSTFNSTLYAEAIRAVASSAGCGSCGDPNENPVKCTFCEIFVVNVVYSTTRRLLAGSVTVDTKIQTPKQTVATAVAQSLNSTSSLEVLSKFMGTIVVMQQPPQVIIEFITPPAPADNASLVIIVATVVGVLVIVAVIVVVVVVLSKHQDPMRPISAGTKSNSQFPERKGSLIGHRVIPKPPQQPRNTQLVFRMYG